MEGIRIIWWVVLVMFFVVHIGCTTQGIQPHPIYRAVNKRMVMTRTIPKKTSLVSSTAALVLGLLFGGLVYWGCLYCSCPRTG